jgi:hypothetical protein
VQLTWRGPDESPVTRMMIDKDVRFEIRRILQSSAESGICLRAVGGLAVYLTCPNASANERLKRAYADIDLVGLNQESSGLDILFSDLGYVANQRFNALHGQTRLLYYDPASEGHLDIFLDTFQMCHNLDLRKRLLDGYQTLTLADLLITKLQIVEMNEKDLKDILALLLDHAPGFEAPCQVDVNYIAGLCADDWGLYTTITDNLRRLETRLEDYFGADELEKVSSRIEQIRQHLDSTPRSLRWKIRSKIGRRWQWYNLPEEVNR